MSYKATSKVSRCYPHILLAFHTSPIRISVACHTQSPRSCINTSTNRRVPGPTFLIPTPDDIAHYLYISFASSAANVIPVPTAYAGILGASAARLAWWKRTWPKQQYTHLRVFSWSTWAHVIGLTNDLGLAEVLTAGCYSHRPPARYLDVCGQLETAITKQRTTFAGVPWVLEGLTNAECIEWAIEMGIPLVLDIGMTEVGGAR